MAQTIDTLQVQFEAVGSNFERSINRLFGKGGVMIAAVTGAVAAAGVAVGGFAAKGIKDFTDLDTAMREVFTLLPGISDEAMQDMTDQVQAFSKEFGRLPSDVVPALYQALSAGVPKDNVFSFLETANAAARAGVTDLETAVDGLTSVVNAYGAEVITADEASDAMFTAIRLGKTTYEELAGVISRVTVPAAAAGVTFDDVTAALAAMTAQGTPTAEAATQLRAVINELSKEGQVAYDNFKRITGESFPEFIAGGGTVGEALTLLAEDAEASGGRVNDSFGSIEAGMGALTLTSEAGSVLFQNALTAMDEKAGATDEAFQTMDEGIQASWDRLKAGFAVLSTEVGEKLAPLFQKAVDFVVGTVMPALETTVLAVFDAIVAGVTWLQEKWTEWGDDTDSTGGRIRGTFESVQEALRLVFEALGALWTEVLQPVWDAIAPFVEASWNTMTDTIQGAIDAISAILNILIGFLTGDWERAWQGVQDLAGTVWGTVQSVVENAWTALKTTFDSVIEYLDGYWRDSWNALSGFFENLWGNIRTGVENAWGGIRDALSNIWDDIGRVASTAWQTVVDGITGAFNGIREFFSNLWSDLVNGIRGSINDIIGLVNKLIDGWNDLSFTFGGGTLLAPRSLDLGPLGSIEIPGISIPSVTFNTPNIGHIPMLAAGGILTQPTLAMIGEAGPEAVIPLDRLNGMMGSQTIIVELDGRVLTQAVAPRLVQQARIKTGLIGI